AVLERLVAGNAVADHVIERGAGRLLVAAIHKRRGQGAMVHRIFEDQPVDFLGRHARSDMLRQHVEAARNKLPRLAHGFECGGAVDLDLASLADWGDGGVEGGHCLQCKVCSVWCKRAFVNASVGDLSAQFVLDMGTHNIVERSFGLEPEVACTLGIRSLSPPGEYSLDQLIVRPADARGHLVACNTAKRIDLFADRAGYARHCEVDARTDLLACEVRGVDEKPDRGPRARMRVADA